MSRLENAPSKIEIARLMAAMVDGFCDSYRRAPPSITLDIDDTCDTVHGHQQLSLFNAHYDERCFLPIHIYDAISGKPVAMILREGKTPSGEEVRTVLKHVIKRIRRHWPKAGARHRYETLYCARGNAENFIKLHKSQLASDRTSCRDPKANQFRLILHTAAYWLMLAMRSAVPARSQLSHAEFATMRLRLIKIAARVVEGAARDRKSTRLNSSHT